MLFLLVLTFLCSDTVHMPRVTKLLHAMLCKDVCDVIVHTKQRDGYHTPLN